MISHVFQRCGNGNVGVYANMSRPCHLRRKEWKGQMIRVVGGPVVT